MHCVQYPNLGHNFVLLCHIFFYLNLAFVLSRIFRAMLHPIHDLPHWSSLFSHNNIMSFPSFNTQAPRAPRIPDPLMLPECQNRSSNKLIQEVLSCEPVLNFLKSDHNWLRHGICFYLQNCPVKFDIEIIYTPSTQNSSGNRLLCY